MRTGFLGSQTPVSTPAAGKEARNHASIGADKPMEPPPGGDGSGSPAKSTLTPAQMTAGLEECLDLLRGPTDERRCVREALLLCSCTLGLSSAQVLLPAALTLALPLLQVCGLVAGDQAAACWRQRNHQAGVRGSGACFPQPPAAAAAHDPTASQPGTNRRCGRRDSAAAAAAAGRCAVWPGPCRAVQLCSRARAGRR
jgi:hypothetical protein